jgi:hypothetical protein
LDHDSSARVIFGDFQKEYRREEEGEYEEDAAGAVPQEHVAGLRLNPGILPVPYGNEQIQCGNQKGFRNVLGGVRPVQQEQPMIEDGCEIGRNGYE